MAKRLAAITIEQLRQSGAAGDAFLRNVDATEGSSNYRCICGCGVRGDSTVPSVLSIDPSALRKFLSKLVASDKRLEDILAAFSLDARAACQRFRFAAYHTELPAEPFLGREAPGTPRCFPVARLFASTAAGVGPVLALMPTPGAPAGTPQLVDVTSRPLRRLKGRLAKDDFSAQNGRAQRARHRRHGVHERLARLEGGALQPRLLLERQRPAAAQLGQRRLAHRLARGALRVLGREARAAVHHEQRRAAHADQPQQLAPELRHHGGHHADHAVDGGGAARLVVLVRLDQLHDENGRDPGPKPCPPKTRTAPRAWSTRPSTRRGPSSPFCAL